MSWQNIHMGQSVTGPLRNWTARDWKRATGYIKRHDGTRFTASELKDTFLKELSAGHEVIPIGECDNWDWKTGCKGHPMPAEEAAELDKEFSK